MKINKLIPGTRAFAKMVTSKITGRPIPIWAWNYITNRCNLNCKYCFVAPYWDKAKDFTFEELCRIFDEEKEMGVEIMTLLGGEPMMRKDFSDIVDYLDKKGVIIDVITNGYFVKNHKKALNKIDSMCVSLDGNEEMTDYVRGKGAYKVAIDAIKFVKSKGVSVRIHGVITKHTIHALPEMAKLCKKLGVSATYAMPSIHQNEDLLRVPDNEIRKFWKLYLKMKKEGAPFIQTNASIKTIINWPYPYYKILTKKDLPLTKNVKKCVMKDRLILLGGTGEPYPCTVKYNQKGLNVKNVGVKKAFDHLRQTDDCVACSDLSCINLSLIANLDRAIVSETIQTFLKTYLKND